MQTKKREENLVLCCQNCHLAGMIWGKCDATLSHIYTIISNTNIFYWCCRCGISPHFFVCKFYITGCRVKCGCNDLVEVMTTSFLFFFYTARLYVCATHYLSTSVCHLPASGRCPSCGSCSSFPLPQFFSRLSSVNHASAFPQGSSGLQLW